MSCSSQIICSIWYQLQSKFVPLICSYLNGRGLYAIGKQSNIKIVMIIFIKNLMMSLDRDWACMWSCLSMYQQHEKGSVGTLSTWGLQRRSINCQNSGRPHLQSLLLRRRGEYGALISTMLKQLGRQFLEPERVKKNLLSTVCCIL